MADAAQPRMAELVELTGDDRHRPLLGHRALGDDDDRERTPALMATSDQTADPVDVERDLGDQDHVGAAGQARMQRDPARAAAHHLDHHDPVMALGGRVQAVDRLGRDRQRRVEAKGLIGGAEIVVDRLRHADHLDPRFRQPGGGAERVLAADRDQTVEAVARERLGDDSGTVLALGRVRARAAEDRPAAREDPARGLDRQVVADVVEHPAPTVAKPDELGSVRVDALAHRRADDGVQPRAVASAGQQPDPHAAHPSATTTVPARRTG